MVFIVLYNINAECKTALQYKYAGSGQHWAVESIASPPSEPCGRRHTSRKYLSIRYNMLTHTGVAHLYIFHFLNAVKRALHSSLKLQLGIPTGIHRNLALIKVHMQRHRHQVPSTKTDPEHVTGSHGSYPTLNSITKFSQF